MKNYNKIKICSIIIFLLMITTFFAHITSSKNLYSNDKQRKYSFDGQILYSPFFGTTTYLINCTGVVNHTWLSEYRPFTEAYLLDNGSIIRPILSSSGVQKILWDGTIVWDYRYTVSGCTCHHDVEYLPNGNVLMIVWETKTRAQAIEAGRDPNKIQGFSFTPDKIIEVKQTGPTSGDIVWEWKVWDHLIQDFDPSKDNYGVVGDHPELIDINYGDTFTYDWLHSNSIDYHPEFDQILLDVHNFNEVWVIDHSTTTEEAAGHTGGIYGEGGDLLYRWGNPEAYDAGTDSDQKLFFQHDASWVKPGYPGEGNIIVFSNGNNRPSGQYSTIEEFTPPVNSSGEYYLEPGSAYGPEDYTWTYTASPPTSFYSHVYGGVQRLKDGNTFVCYGTQGVFFVVSPDNTKVWEWTNPYPNLNENDVFKIEYIPPPEEEPPEPDIPDLDCEGSLSWSNIKPGAIVEGSFKVQNIGDNGSRLNWTIDMSSITWGNWTFTPSYGENLTPEDGQVTIKVSVVAPNEIESEFQGNITIENKDNSSDFGLIPVYLKTPLNINVKYPSFFQFMSKLKNMFSVFVYNLLEKLPLYY
ncbi:hypothetical protein AYK24_06420 [Thermoplasmatales archaeon SG8-52-4]|nr:MAG: hypothetical protein AYK24_06420 [Thermoplasmatales archaeon SG8-52-4]